MHDKKFDPKKLKKLNNPERLKDTPPELIWSKLKLSQPEILIDIGAGTGFFSVPFSELADQGKVYACDISDTMLDWMKEHVCPDHNQVIPVKMEENQVDLPSDFADLVFMINLHHELSDPVLLLKESFRLLKKGGKVAVVDWLKKDMDQGPPSEIRCTSPEVKGQMESVGFSEVETYEEMVKHFLVVGSKP